MSMLKNNWFMVRERLSSYGSTPEAATTTAAAATATAATTICLSRRINVQ